MTLGRSSEKLGDQVEQLEVTLADIDEMLGEITPANDAADAQAELPGAVIAWHGAGFYQPAP
jgi:hypothetical protein